MESLPPKFDSLIGVTLVERYHIKSKLGQGGMGSVYTAHDDVLDRDVAIKTVPRTNLNDIELVRFHREGKAASTIRHPNVIQMLDFGLLENGQPYMVMELINGVSIADLLAAEGPLEPDLALKVVEQVASGMVAVHKEDILHRDLKTNNIMLTNLGSKDMLVRIVDFGIAKTHSHDAETSALTKAGQIFGSPHYMSPEQIRGDELDNRADVYSLGCILFEMLTGQTLFAGETVMEVVTKHLSDPVPRLWEVTEEKFPMELERLVAHMVAKERDERFGSMDEVIEYIAEVKEVVDEDMEQKRIAAAEAARQQAETGVFKKRQLDKRVIVAGMAAALMFLAGSIWMVVNALTQNKPPAVEKQNRVDQKKRHKSLESAEFEFSVLDKTPDLNFRLGVNHSGTATPALQKLVLTHPKLSEADKEKFDLIFIDSKFVPSDVKLIAKLKPARLQLDGCTGVDEKMLAEIAKIQSIASISLNMTHGLSPSALAQLSALPRLVSLSLDDCDLTDAHLQAMSKIQTLCWISVRNNLHVTTSGIAKLGRKQLPMTVVVNQPPLLMTSAEKQLDLRKKYNIVLEQSPLDKDQGAGYFRKLGGMIDEDDGFVGAIEAFGSDRTKYKGKGQKGKTELSPEAKKLLRHLE